MTDMKVIIDDKGYRVVNCKANFALQYVDAEIANKLIDNGAPLILAKNNLHSLISDKGLDMLVNKQKQLYFEIGDTAKILIMHENKGIHVKNLRDDSIYGKGTCNNKYIISGYELMRQAKLARTKVKNETYLLDYLGNNEYDIRFKNYSGITEGSKLYTDEIDNINHFEIIKLCSDMGIHVMIIHGDHLMTDCKNLKAKIPEYVL